MSQHLNDDDRTAALLDRLVCDELSPSERTEVLRWLDADARRWRQCALVFLEAQVWRKALRIESLASPIAAPSVATPRAKTAQPKGAWLAIAALVLLAFGGGWGGASWLNRTPSDHDAGAMLVGGVKSAKGENAIRDQQSSDAMKTLFASFGLVRGDAKAEPFELKVPVPMSESTFNPGVDVVISESERKKWEQRGLRVSKVREYVPGKLPDGKPVVMSVDRLRVERVGVPTI